MVAVNHVMKLNIHFFSNDHCKKLMEDCTTQLPNLFETNCFGNPKAAGSYKEDEWTERLYHCLGFNNIDAEFTTPYRGYKITKSWETRIPTDVDNKCLLFQGSPDMIIKFGQRRNEGILNFGVEQQEDVAPQIYKQCLRYMT